MRTENPCTNFFNSSAQALEPCWRHLRDASESPVIQEGRKGCIDFWKWVGGAFSKHWCQEIPAAWTEGNDWCHQTIANKTYLCHKLSRAFYKSYQPDWEAVACLQLGVSVIPIAIGSSLYHLSMGVYEQWRAVSQIRSKYQRTKGKKDFNGARFFRLETKRLVPSSDGRCVKAVTSLVAGAATVIVSLYGLYNPLDVRLPLLAIRQKWLGRFKIPSQDLKKEWETLSICQTAIGYFNGSLSLFHRFAIEPQGYLRAIQSPPRTPRPIESDDEEEQIEGMRRSRKEGKRRPYAGLELVLEDAELAAHNQQPGQQHRKDDTEEGERSGEEDRLVEI